MTDIEIWRDIPRSNGLYQASSFGRVRRTKSGRLLKLTTRSRDGYVQVDLCDKAQRATFGVHALVCEAFHGLCPPAHEAAHTDGIKSNNTPGNLAWVTRKENVRHKRLHGVQTCGEQVTHSVLTAADVLSIRARSEAGESYNALAAAFGVRHQTIEKIVKRQRWAHVLPEEHRTITGISPLAAPPEREEL